MTPALTEMGIGAVEAARNMASLPGRQRADALRAMAAALPGIRSELQQANDADISEARLKGLPDPLIARLAITDKIFAYMQMRLNQVAALPDPVGRVLEGHIRPNNLKVEKLSVPIGVIGIIYESRPNVTTDAAAVCIKSGNAVILRGGSESLRTNIVLADAMIRAATEHGLPASAIQIVRTPGHESVSELLRMDRYIDVLIPRGGKGLIRRISEASRIPVIKHYDGICHLYLAEDAPAKLAVDIAINSKCQRVEVCNALEKVLIHAQAAPRLLPELVEAFTAQGVELRGCPRCSEQSASIVPATDEDWTAEYLAPILAIKIVDQDAEAIEHINRYGSGHTDGIVTNSLERVERFVRSIDSSSVMINASTRLSGGGDYGMGAVVGISTDKLHARGPVGPNELTSYKWVAYGQGHLRA
jgi:glutamate-5-semialdehyde dehydrogenase